MSVWKCKYAVIGIIVQVLVVVLLLLHHVSCYQQLVPSNDIHIDVWAEVTRLSGIFLAMEHLKMYSDKNWMTDGLKQHGGWLDRRLATVSSYKFH